MPTLTPRRRAALVAAVAPWLWFAVRDAHPWLDAVALGWPVLGVAGACALVLLGLARRWGGAALAGLSWLLATVAVVVLPWVPLDTGTPRGGLRVTAVNTLAEQTSPEAMAAAIERTAPDLVVVSEVGRRLDAILSRRYPHRVHRLGVAVFSTFPLRPPKAAPAGQRGLRTEVDGPHGPLVLYALHLQKPGVRPSTVEVGLRTHRRVVDAVAASVEGERLPVVLAGDLNLIDRSSGYRRLTGPLDDAMRAGWAQPTSLRATTRPLLARIDHILVEDSWCAAGSRMFGLPGSDHRGVTAAVGPCR